MDEQYADLHAAFVVGRTTQLSFEEWLAGTGWAPMEDLNLPVRLYNALRRDGCRTVADVKARFDEANPHVLDLPHIGFKSYEEGKAALAEWDRKVKS